MIWLSEIKPKELITQETKVFELIVTKKVNKLMDELVKKTGKVFPSSIPNRIIGILIQWSIRQGKQGTKVFTPFSSYKTLIEFLAVHGETGKYFASSDTVKAVRECKEISVEKCWDEERSKYFRVIKLDGSYC